MMRRAVLARCSRCRATTVAGYDDGGLVTEVDPWPVTRLAELRAHLDGRGSWTLDQGRLVRRDRWRIRRPTAVTYLEHRCADPPRGDDLAPATPRTSPTVTDSPPY